METSRRAMFALSALVGAAFATRAAAQPVQREQMKILPAQTRWAPAPPQAPQVEGMADLGDVKLYYWDTGGVGAPVLFLHPATGSAAMWGYQQPVLAKAGFRVIAYSRRGFYRSENGPAGANNTNISDLEKFVDKFALDRFHLVGLAAGGYLVPEYALRHQQRLLSITVAGSLGNVSDPHYEKVTQGLLPATFAAMPQYMRELGPSYRAAYPEGVARWSEIASAARNRDAPTPGGAAPALPGGALTWRSIEQIKTPALFMTGDADMYLPPSRLREWRQRLPQAHFAVLSECGHAGHWEQYEAFNAMLIDFLRRNSRGYARRKS